MSVLIRGVRPYGAGEQLDVLVDDGQIAEMRPAGPSEGAAPPDAEVIEAPGQVLLPGLVDLHTHLREPGREYAEDIQTGSAAALERGSMIHRLLQVLPGIPPAERQTVLARYLARALPAELADAAQAIEAQVLAVLGDPAFAPIFDAPGEAEVSVMGTLHVAGEERAVSGRIDRIALDGDRVLIVDYKTGLAPNPGEPPPSGHVSQLAIYRALLAPLYPGRRIEAALVYVSGPFLIKIPGSVLDQALINLDR